MTHGYDLAKRSSDIHWPDGYEPQAADLFAHNDTVVNRSAEVVTRLGRGEEVDASEYTFRTSTQIETAAPDLDWLNKGVFISVGGRQAGGVIYETYLVT